MQIFPVQKQLRTPLKEHKTMQDDSLFDIFDFLGIDITEDLEFIQRKLDDLNATQMADLRTKQGFTKIRGFLFSKTTKPAFFDYVQTIRKQRGEESKPQPKLQPQSEQNLKNRHESEVFSLIEQLANKPENRERQRLADAINQTSNRKVTLSAICAQLFAKGESSPCIGFSCFAFFFPCFLLGFVGVFDYFIVNLFEEVCGLGFSILGLLMFIPHCLALFRLKNGFCTVGYLLDDERIVFRDSKGEYQCQNIPNTTWLYSLAPLFNPNYSVSSMIIFIDKHKPENILYFEEMNSIKYDEQRHTFTQDSKYLQRLWVPIVGILWLSLFILMLLFPN